IPAENVGTCTEVEALRYLPQTQAPHRKWIRVAGWIPPRLEQLFWFFICLPTGAADECSDSCCGTAGCAGAAEQNAACVDKGHATATVAGRNRIHAGDDRASFASGGDDGADCITHGE